MSAFEIVMMILLLVMGVFLVVSMLLQKSKKGLSSTISGGMDTYYDRDGSARTQRLLNLITTVVAVAFIVIVFVVYAIQPNYGDIITGNEWQSGSAFYKEFTSK